MDWPARERTWTQPVRNRRSTASRNIQSSARVSCHDTNGCTKQSDAAWCCLTTAAVIATMSPPTSSPPLTAGVTSPFSLLTLQSPVKPRRVIRDFSVSYFHVSQPAAEKSPGWLGRIPEHSLHEYVTFWSGGSRWEKRKEKEVLAAPCRTWLCSDHDQRIKVATSYLARPHLSTMGGVHISTISGRVATILYLAPTYRGEKFVSCGLAARLSQQYQDRRQEE